MDTLQQVINEWIRQILISVIQENTEDIFASVNSKVGEASTLIGTTPKGWNGTIYGIIENISQTVIIPIAGVIITYVLCYELITMVTEKNNLHDLDSWMFVRFFLKAGIAIYLVTYTFDIVMAVFELGQTVITKATGPEGLDTNAVVTIDFAAMGLEEMSLGKLVILTLEIALVKLLIQLMFVLITLILYSRIIMIYLYASVSPIPFATFTNRDWGSIGQNYLKGLLALAFQGFFMLLCVGIYAALVSDFDSGSPMQSLWTAVGYGALLCFMLFKTDSISKSIFNAH